MYKRIVASEVRKGYALISAGRFDDALAKFGKDVRFQMMGDHPLGGEQRGIEQTRAWFAEMHRLFPDLKLEADELTVQGFPWDMRVATRFRVSASLAGGGRYENRGVQWLRLRWGKAVEDRLFEDTQLLADAIEHQRRAAAEAEAAPA